MSAISRPPPVSSLQADLITLKRSKEILRRRHISLEYELIRINEEETAVETNVNRLRQKLRKLGSHEHMQEVFVAGLGKKVLVEQELVAHKLGDGFEFARLKPYPCQLEGCARRYLSYREMELHFRRLHTDETLIVCQFEKCRKQFRRKDFFKLHMRKHLGVRPFKCNHGDCKKSFVEKQNLTKHSLVHLVKKPFVCRYDDCEKTFTTKHSLSSHERIHTGEKPYVCNFDDCRKSFSHSGNLETHKRQAHTAEKPYVCSVSDCRKAFSNWTHLADHRMRHHTCEKRFQCEYDGCEKRFVTTTERANHHRRHAGEKPFECGVCGKRTMTLGDLRVHERVHSGDRPYPCSKCSKRFAKSSHRNTHIKTCKIFPEK